MCTWQLASLLQLKYVVWWSHCHMLRDHRTVVYQSCFLHYVMVYIFMTTSIHQSLAWLLFDLLSYCLILMKQLVSDLFGLYALLPFVCWLGKWLSFVFYWRFCEFVSGWSWKKHFRFVLQSKPKPKGSFSSSIELQIFYSNQHAHHFTCSSPDFATITKPSRRYNHPTKHLSQSRS